MAPPSPSRKGSESRKLSALRCLALLAVGLAAVTWLHGEEPTPIKVLGEELGAQIGGRLRRTRRNQPEKRSWGPEQAEGAPDTPQAGDSSSAWASLGQDDQPEWLICEYEAPIDVRAVVVHATYNPGALTKVTAFNAAGDEVIAWEGEDPTPKTSARGVSVIPVKMKFPVKKIKISLDSQGVEGWNEIDAVGLEDGAGKQHWANKVEASSTYASPRTPTPSARQSYTPEQITGAPDTGTPGDQGTAWASASPDNQPEWLVCQYETAQQPVEIVVHENTAPGAIVKVSVYNDKDEEVVVWEGVDPTPRDQPWGVSVFPVKTEFAFKKLKLYIDSHKVPGYNEVDAVGLRALSGDTQWAKEAQASTTYGVDAAVMVLPATPAQPDTDEAKMSVDQQAEIKLLRKEVDELKALLKEKLKKETKP